MNRAEKREQNKTISWAAKHHDQYVMLNGELHYCLACMRHGKGALQLIDSKERASFFTMDMENLIPGVNSATDGDIVIARLAGELPGPEMAYKFYGEAKGATSCKALRRKIKYWREKDGKSNVAR